MRRIWRRALWVALLVGLVSAALFYRDLREQSRIGAGYVAHQICSCVFVAGRSHDTCLPDMMPVMDRIRSEVLDGERGKRVRAWIPLLTERVAWHTPGRGCTLD